MHQNHKSKKRIVYRLSLLFLGVFLLLAGYFGIRHPGRIYQIVDRLTRHPKALPLIEVETDTGWKNVSYQSLQADPRVVVDQSMLLINQSYPMGNKDRPDIDYYKETTVMMNTCVMEPYQELAADVYDIFEEKLFIRSSYRTREMQVEQIEEEGDYAASIGASEHQFGLALDVYVPYFAGLGFLDCDAGKWVQRHACDYGFIIRYPTYGVDITGIKYEPWHLRYIGLPHAQMIDSHNLTLEEYMESFQVDHVYEYDQYYLSRQSSKKLLVPEQYTQMNISEDHMGNYFITVWK